MARLDQLLEPQRSHIAKLPCPSFETTDRGLRAAFGTTKGIHLEHDILRKQYSEPRIHMVLVCAAKGCPQLRGNAYTAEKLDEQLNDQTRRYLSSTSGLSIDRDYDWSLNEKQ